MINRLPVINPSTQIAGKAKSAMSIDDPVVFLSLDIETRGPNMIQHGILSIGYAVGFANKNKLVKKGRFNLQPMQGQFYDKDTFSNFWVYHEEMRQEMEKQAEHPIQAISKFRQMLDHLDSKFDVRIICDNPGFDFGFINYYLSAAKLSSLNYKVHNAFGNFGEQKKTYRMNYDFYSYVMGTIGSDFDYPGFSKNRVMDGFGITIDTTTKDHYPENDAEWNYRFLIQLILATSQSNK